MGQGPRRRVVETEPSGMRQTRVTLSCGHVYYVSAHSARYQYGSPKTLTCEACVEKSPSKKEG